MFVSYLVTGTAYQFVVSTAGITLGSENATPHANEAISCSSTSCSKCRSPCNMHGVYRTLRESLSRLWRLPIPSVCSPPQNWWIVTFQVTHNEESYRNKSLI